MKMQNIEKKRKKEQYVVFRTPDAAVPPGAGHMACGVQYERKEKAEAGRDCMIKKRLVGLLSHAKKYIIYHYFLAFIIIYFYYFNKFLSKIFLKKFKIFSILSLFP